MNVCTLMGVMLLMGSWGFKSSGWVIKKEKLVCRIDRRKWTWPILLCVLGNNASSFRQRLPASGVSTFVATDYVRKPSESACCAASV